MGIKGLLSELSGLSKHTSIENLCQRVGKRVAIDGMGWLHRFGMVCARDLALQTGKAVEKIVKVLKAEITLLLNEGIGSVIIVFDGGKVPLKKEVDDARTKRREHHLHKGIEFAKAGDRPNARKCFNAAICFTGEDVCVITQLINLWSSGLPSLKHVEAVIAPYESDAQLTYLYAKGNVDWIISEDSDLLVFGCHSAIKVLYKLDFGSASGMLYDMSSLFVDSTPEHDPIHLSARRTRFLQGCILAGCDYLASVHGVGIKKAMHHVSSEKSLETILRDLGASASYEKRFHQAQFTFLHQPVFDPELGICVPLTPYTELDLRGMSSTDFAGRVYSNHSLVKSIYNGMCHPILHSSCSVPSSLVRAADPRCQSVKRERLITDYFERLP